MSIRPEFAARLLAGEKQVEFRRRPAARGVTHILIYATSPVRAVVGVAEVERLERASPRELWSAFADVAGIARSDFFAYFAGTRMGCAYVVKRIWSCSPPTSLGRHGLPRTAPQAFQYIGGKTLEAVLNRSVVAGARATNTA